MNNIKRLKLIAPCGIDCGVCELFICRDNSDLLNSLIAKGISKDILPCDGCRPRNGMCPLMSTTCKTFDCITKNKVYFCYECADFPCTKLHPSSDRAAILPHNMKVFNLCKIKNTSLQEFALLSAKIKHRYYTGKMKIGEGPQIES